MIDPCPAGSYTDDSKLRARQALWRFEQRTPGFRGRVYSVIEPNGDEVVVDIGCGNGSDLRDLHRGGHAGPLLGFDRSPGMLAAASANVPTATLTVADAQQVPVADRSADITLAMHMLYHVPDIEAAVAEARRITAPDGVFLASTNGEATMPELLAVWNEALAEVAGPQPPLERLSLSRFSLENGAAFLGTAFDDVELRRFPGSVDVPDAAVIRDYVASTEELYAQLVPVDGVWGAVADAVGRKAAAVIERRGTFHITADRGVFVCR